MSGHIYQSRGISEDVRGLRFFGLRWGSFGILGVYGIRGSGAGFGA